VADTFQDKKLTQDQADELQAPMELDLTALFKVIKDDILEMSEDYEGSPDSFINDVLLLLSESGGEVRKNIKENAMPKPKPGESEQDFISRCVPIVMNEGDTKDQALGKCYGIYRNIKKDEMFKVAGKMLDIISERNKK